MERCFVIQPFDGGVYDKRYEDVFAPAIKAANLDPYRVDKDPSVVIPINDIESGIKMSALCLADISTDNPNVWYELGFAFASDKEVVLICSDERKSRFPFDVQHRNIIKYKNESTSDFEKLARGITERIGALLKKESEIERLSTTLPLSDTEGLSTHAMVALVTVMQNQMSPHDSVSAYTIKQDMIKAGFTEIAVSLGLTSILRKEMVETTFEQDINGEQYAVYRTLEKGTNWLLQNESKLLLRTPKLQNDSNELPF